MKRLAAENYAGMSTVVRTVTNWVGPFIVLYGLYILSVAHQNPGGALESGVILACGFILFLLAYGKRPLLSKVPLPVIAGFVSVGALVFWIMTFGRIYLGDALSIADRIPLAELAIAIEVLAAIALLVVSLSALRVKGAGSDEDFITEIDE